MNRITKIFCRQDKDSKGCPLYIRALQDVNASCYMRNANAPFAGKIEIVAHNHPTFWQETYANGGLLIGTPTHVILSYPAD